MCIWSWSKVFGYLYLEVKIDGTNPRRGRKRAKKGSIFSSISRDLYTTYISSIGWLYNLYITYHLLREPGNSFWYSSCTNFKFPGTWKASHLFLVPPGNLIASGGKTRFGTRIQIVSYFARHLISSIHTLTYIKYKASSILPPQVHAISCTFENGMGTAHFLEDR